MTRLELALARAVFEARARVAVNRDRLELDRTMADCRSCMWPHVHTIGGEPIGTVCQEDGVCWREERRRLASARRQETEDQATLEAHDGRTNG